MICLFGGTFDPVHLGHLHAAERVLTTLAVPEIRLLLSARPSHKASTGASLEDRWAMLSAACAERQGLIADNREALRDKPSYTVDTLLEFRAEQPREALTWVIGSDAYALLPSWYRWESVLELANLVVLARPGPFPTLDATMTELTERHRVDDLDGCHEGGILLMEDAMEEVSAAEVRERVAAGLSVSHLLPAVVANYISSHHLYGG